MSSPHLKVGDTLHFVELKVCLKNDLIAEYYLLLKAELK